MNNSEIYFLERRIEHMTNELEEVYNQRKEVCLEIDTLEQRYEEIDILAKDVAKELDYLKNELKLLKGEQC